MNFPSACSQTSMVISTNEIWTHAESEARTEAVERLRLRAGWIPRRRSPTTAMVASAQTGRAQEAPGIACIIKADTGNADIGGVSDMRGLPGGEVLMGTSNGLFLARVMNGAFTVDPAGNADTGDVSDMRDWPGGGVLIAALKGLFLAHVVNGAVTVDPAGNTDTGSVFEPRAGLSRIRDFPGGVLIQAEKGLFLAHVANGAVPCP